MTEPQDKNISYAHIFLQKAMFELLFAVRFDDAKTGNVVHEQVLILQRYFQITDYAIKRVNESYLNCNIINELFLPGRTEW